MRGCARWLITKGKLHFLVDVVILVGDTGGFLLCGYLGPLALVVLGDICFESFSDRAFNCNVSIAAPVHLGEGSGWMGQLDRAYSFAGGDESLDGLPRGALGGGLRREGASLLAES